MTNAHPAAELKDRTKAFALRIIKMIRGLPPGMESRVIGHQLLRCGTAVAANYRAVCRARSRAEFVSKMSIVLEEADEAAFWLELIVDAELISETRLGGLRAEANELVAIFNASRNTARKNREDESPNS
jgi:four helix bundle protein